MAAQGAHTGNLFFASFEDLHISPANSNCLVSRHADSVEETTTIKHGPSGLDLGGTSTNWIAGGITCRFLDSTNWTVASTGNNIVRGGCWIYLHGIPDTVAGDNYGAFMRPNFGNELGMKPNGSTQVDLIFGSQASQLWTIATLDIQTWYYIEWRLDVGGGATATQRVWIDGTHYSGSYGEGSGGAPTNFSMDMWGVVECLWWAHGDGGATGTDHHFDNPAMATMLLTSDDAILDDWTGNPDTTNKYENINQAYSTSSYNSTNSNNFIQNCGTTQNASGKWTDTINSYEAVSWLFALNKNGTNPSLSVTLYANDLSASNATLSGDILINEILERHFGYADHLDSGAAAWGESDIEGASIEVEHNQAQSRTAYWHLGLISYIVELQEGTADVRISKIREAGTIPKRYHMGNIQR